MIRVAGALLLALATAGVVEGQEPEPTRLIVRPTLAFVMGPHHEGTVASYEGEYPILLEYDDSRVTPGVQVEYNIDAHLFVMAGGQTALHTAITRLRTAGRIWKEEDRQFIHLWAGAGLRSRFITFFAGPLLSREQISDVVTTVDYSDRRTTRCPDQTRHVDRWGSMAGAMFEFPISSRANFSAAIQRHGVHWNPDAKVRYGGCDMLPWTSPTGANPTFWSFQAGVAIPVF